MHIAVVNVPALAVVFGPAAGEFGHAPSLLRLARLWSAVPALQDSRLLNNARKVRNRLFVDGRLLSLAGGLNLRPNPAGRPKGARARLSEDFLRDLHEAWGKHGIAALERCASESPDVFVRTVAGLMPREATLDVDVSIWTSATNVLEAYRLAAGVLGTDPAVGLKRLRKIAPNLDIYDVGE
jgi:hypothetical protein